MSLFPKSSSNPASHALNRRQFLAGLREAAKYSAIVISVPSLLVACGRADNATTTLLPSSYHILSADLAELLDAVTARIVPSDSTPGAREAGTVNFIDFVIHDGRQNQLSILEDGAIDLNNKAANQFGAKNFAALQEDQQDQLLHEIESSEFFGTARYLTVASLFAFPQYGGNGPDTGFALIGMNHAHAYMPPFGYYDADYAARGE